MMVLLGSAEAVGSAYDDFSAVRVGGRPMRSPGRSKIALYITSLKKNGVVHHSKKGNP